MRTADQVELSNRDHEPIHGPGSIQPHGCLLVCDEEMRTVLRHSANAPAMLGLAGEINGGALIELVGGEAAHALRNARAITSDPSRPATLLELSLPGGGAFDVAVHGHNGAVILELEPASPAKGSLARTRELIGRLAGITDLDELAAKAVRIIRALLGYDRVMLCRFEADGAGKVIGEVKRPDLESSLGEYFPAGDIPEPARTLALRNTLRIISDSDGAPVPIVPALDEAGEPLDLSFAHLRSASPVHCDYLRGLGVTASMTISVIVDGGLWGLIACHHDAPRVPSMADRVSAELFGQFFSLQLQALRQKASLDSATQARRALDRFVHLASQRSEVDAVLRDHLADFRGLMPCDGVGLSMNGRWSSAGAAPPAASIPDLARFVGATCEGRIWATHALPRAHPPAEAYHEAVSGLLAIPVSEVPRDYLFLFRRERVRTLNRAGDPDESDATDPLGRSVAIRKETVSRQAEPWTDADREIAEAARAAIVEVLRHNEMMTEERSRAAVRQRMLSEELNHRVKNILAVIRSLVSHTVHDGRDLDDYVEALKGRIQALAFAHDQVVRGDGGGMLADLLRAELGPYGDRGATVSLDGPPVWLDSRAFSVMALVLHELATNAARYGALSRPSGRLALAWSLEPDGACRLAWRERGGPPVVPPTRAGFGSALVGRAVPFDLGGEGHVSYAPEGVEARFLLPGRHVSGAGLSAAAPAPHPARGAEPRPTALPADLAVLLVEDQILIAMDVEAILEEAGVARVTTAGTIAEAQAALSAGRPDVAILDVNLGQTTSIPLADALARLQIPFAFATGYGDAAVIPDAHRAAPLLRKPYDAAALVACLARLVGSRP
jgi:light-regulated signal transduction histidine kinase (bacteriophytochrome)